MKIFVYERLTTNPGIGNNPVWVFPNIWRLGQIRDTKFGTNVFEKAILNAAKYQGYSFYLSELIRENQLGGKNTLLSPP